MIKVRLFSFPEFEATRAVVTIGVASGALYAAVYALQRALWPLAATSSLRTITALYVVSTLALVALYGAIVALASNGGLRNARARRLAFAIPVLFSVALTMGRPYLSTDLLTYIAQGHQVRAGQNPYAVPAKALAHTRFGGELMAHGWIPVDGVSPYGPLWTEFEAAVAWTTSDILTQALLIKMVVTAFSLGCAWIVWLILGHVSVQWQTLGTVLYLWNPVVLVEFAGEGHNEAAMIFFVLLALYFWIRSRSAAAVAALGVGALVKLTVLLIAPLEVVYAWRTCRSRRSLWIAIGSGAAVAAIVALIAYAPVWIGMATLDGLREHGRPGLTAASTPSVVYWYLTHTYSARASARLLSVLIGGAFLGYTAFASLKIVDASSLLRACGRVAFAYVLLAPGYWPWYAAMPIALMALAPSEMFVWSILALSLASRLVAPIDLLQVNGAIDWETEIFVTTLIGIWAPAAFIGVLAACRARAVWPERYPALIAS